MQNISVFLVLIMLSMCTQENRCLKRSCPWSIRTLQYVSDCPITKEDVEAYAKIKDCEALAWKQNCTDPSEFKYHCVINDQGNALVEVCAPVYYIHGFCTEFNAQGSIIQPHFGIRCNNITPCAGRYLSTSAYRYPKCYDAIKNRTTSSLTEATTFLYNTTVHFATDGSDDLILYLLIPSASVLLALMLALLVWLYRRKKARAQAKTIKSDDEDATWLLQFKNSKEKPKVEIDCESIISQESLTDKSVRVDPGRTLKDIDQVSEKVRGELAAENEDLTTAYINSFRWFETYFVETRAFKECKRKLQNNGVAVLVGPPGCGKTTAAIGILKDASYKDWVKQKITSWTGFKFIDSSKNSLIYIDNIFDGFMYQHELEKWWDMLNYIFYEDISQTENMEREDSGLVSNKRGQINLLITAKEDILIKAREFNKIKKTPVFRRNCIVENRSLPLGSKEKDKIFDKQMEYAEKVLNIPKTLVDSQFRHQMKNCVGHVGFPLCAHLYACEKQHRPTGVDFFLYPINYLRKQIKYEIDTDATNSVKTLLLLLFLWECLSLSGISVEPLDLRDSEKCEAFLAKEFSDTMIKEMKPLSFANLETVAIGLSTIISGNEKDRVYQFKHQIICEAAGFYFCTEWSKPAFQYFPIAAFEKHDFLPTDEFCDCFLSRIFEEVNRRNISKAYACAALQQDSFAKRFCELLKSKDVQSFLLMTDGVSDYHFPSLFWICKYNHLTLSKMLFDLMEEKSIQVDYHFYLARLGECCANDENFLRKSNKHSFNSTKELTDMVLQYVGEKDTSILQLVMSSDRLDSDAALIIEKLVHDYRSQNMTPVAKLERMFSCIAKEKRHSRILCMLALFEFEKDTIQKSCPKEHSPVQIVLDTLNECSYNISLELEMLIRISLFIMYVINPKDQSRYLREAKRKFRNTNWKNVEELLRLKSPTQDKMSNLIKNMLKQLHVAQGIELLQHNPWNCLSKPLMNAISTSVHHLRNLRSFCEN